jgi:hypothetical protein
MNQVLKQLLVWLLVVLVSLPWPIRLAAKALKPCSNQRRSSMHMSLSPRPWRGVLGTIALVCALAVVSPLAVQAQQQKPNILVIMGDDIGWFNPSVYHRGIM